MSDVRKAVELMEANKERLRGCTLPHDFRVIPKQAEAFVPYPDYICLKCGGVVRMGDVKGVTEIGGFKVIHVADDYVHPAFVSRDLSVLLTDRYVLVDDVSNTLVLRVQNGPVKEKGVNGCQVDTLIHVAAHMIHKLNIQNNCAENYEALYHLQRALDFLDERRKNREARGVEGTNQP